MKNSERALVIISDLSSRDEISDAYRILYRYLEKEGVEYAQHTIAPLYGKKTILTGADATSVNFINALKNSAKDPIEEVDVLIHLHGIANNYLYFHKNEGEYGALSTDTLRDRIKELKVEKKLRMLYSTACYGASHAKDFVDAGFTCASGAKGINTSTIEYPIFLKKWAAGLNFRVCMNAAENPIANAVSDTIARPLFPGSNVDSDKILFGKTNASINSD